jgi:hypothetical protein
VKIASPHVIEGNEPAIGTLGIGVEQSLGTVAGQHLFFHAKAGRRMTYHYMPGFIVRPGEASPYEHL